MIEKIGQPGTNSEPCNDFINLVKSKKEEQGRVCIAEIGVDIGSTAVEILKYLDDEDRYCFFDLCDVLDALQKDLESYKCIEYVGNTRKNQDSYSWNLIKMVIDMKKKGEDGIFDVVYLDGAHTYLHDGVALCALKELVKVNGYIVVDDVYWSISKSPSIRGNEAVWLNQSKIFTDEQLEACHIDMLLEAFMRSDSNFEQVFFTKNRKPRKATYRRNH